MNALQSQSNSAGQTKRLAAEFDASLAIVREAMRQLDTARDSREFEQR